MIVIRKRRLAAIQVVAYFMGIILFTGNVTANVEKTSHIVGRLENDTVIFNEVSDSGTVIQSRTLGSDFTFDINNPDSWVIPNYRAMAVAPEAPVIAFTARRNGDYRLFLFDFANDEVSQVNAILPYVMDPIWSPDGTALLLVATFFRDDRGERLTVTVPRMVYNLQDESLEEIGFVRVWGWSPDGNGLIQIDGLQLIQTDKRGQNPQTLNNDIMTDLQNSSSIGLICFITWSPYTQRFYYTSRCAGPGSIPEDSFLYSTDLSGNSRTEGVIMDASEGFFFGQLVEIIAQPDEVYVAVRLEGQRDEIANVWRLLRTHESNSLETVIEAQHPSQASLFDIEISPDSSKVAFVGDILLCGVDAEILQVYDIDSQTLNSEVAIENENVCDPLRLDDTTILYQLTGTLSCYRSPALVVVGESFTLDTVSGQSQSLFNGAGLSWALSRKPNP